MKVLLFGRFAELAGWRERDLSAPVPSVGALVQLLAAEAPVLKRELKAPSTLVVRNLDQVQGDAALAAGDEVAFMPPMSGG